MPGPVPLLPPPVLAAGLVCFGGAAALANCSVLAALLRRSTSGLYSIIVHLAVADLFLLASSIAPELWSTNSKNWPFGSSACVAYQGLSVFTSTASQYLVVATSLHSLAAKAIEERATERKMRRKALDGDEEMRSSRRSLVANSDSSTPPRTMDADYRLADTGVPVTLPALFVWFLAASLSIPEFLLAFTIHTDNAVVCTLDSNHRDDIRFLLTIFNLFLPLVLLSSTCALIIVKLRTRKRQFDINNSESVAALKLSLWLIVVNCLFCVPRNTVSAYHAYAESITDHVIPTKVSQQNDVIFMINMAFGCANMLATLIRPVMCIILMPQIRKAFFVSFR